MTTHALNTSTTPAEAGPGLTLLRYLDLIVLALAAPVFLLADLPLLGYLVTAVVWVAQRGLQAYANAKAEASGDPRTVAGVLAGSMIGRGWLVAGSIFAVGMIGARGDGLAAALLAISLFTVYFSSQMVVRPFDEAGAQAGDEPGEHRTMPSAKKSS